MASVQELQALLMQSNDQVRLMGQAVAALQATVQKAEREIETLNGKCDYLHREGQARLAMIAELEAKPGSGSGAGGGSLGSLVNLRTMAPKVYGGSQNESFRTWAKKVRSYCNGHRPGLKRFLKYVEVQKDTIDSKQMGIDWSFKEQAMCYSTS